ncbi:L-threonine 3-dehydrogenase, mitochondrial [Smittium mucronatum]|uniref:L-threonine 3-dehydrogenase, mitochondrial n=1 Tax=Smittium mucronatum TaxID=133383 RepID=A0A1R0GWC9_9FUNG|nr:L-threonine 3-dehydrogenase, mitochondrial [Smittium mucronatum]
MSACRKTSSLFAPFLRAYHSKPLSYSARLSPASPRSRTVSRSGYPFPRASLLSSSGFDSVRQFSSIPEGYKVLITGGCGQLGLAIADNIRSQLGKNSVLLTDIKEPSESIISSGPFEYCDVLDQAKLKKIVSDYDIDCIIHLSIILSALGEKNPHLALNVNINGFQNVLDISKERNIRLMCPSTMGVFGPTSPKTLTPDLTIMRPNTIYGITKVHMELMGEYYAQKYNLDFRSLRYPGIISADSLPGGGTTDYAVDIFHSAISQNSFSCFLKPNARLAMMYLDDCIDATVQLLFAPSEKLSQKVYNINAMSFTPSELAAEIKSQFSPDFKMSYNPDYRQEIADTWPFSLDSRKASEDWGFNPKITSVKELTTKMFNELSNHH